ncbi:hypothetical protein ACOSQ4_027009 [Xanthoceras sorbifolium]
MADNAAQETYDLYEMLGANSEQKSVRGKQAGVQEINSNKELALQVADLTKQLRTIINAQGHQVDQACAICGEYDHTLNNCPSGATYPEFIQKQAQAFKNYQSRARNDPFRTHITRVGGIIQIFPGITIVKNQNPGQVQQQTSNFQPRQQYQNQEQIQNPGPGFKPKPSLEKIVRDLALQNKQTT